MLCLQTALDHQGLGPRISSLQIARPRGVRPPSIDHPRVQVFTMGEAVYLAGVQEQVVSGTPVRVFSVAKTVADCFRYRGRIGLDTAVDGLREVIRTQRATTLEIMYRAQVDRVDSVVGPYLRVLI